MKTTFKSHFRLKKFFKKDEKKIFVKNMVMFLLFSKIFFKNCKISLLFSLKKKTQTSLLKAPSRHKKFFHQIVYEVFLVKIFFKFNKEIILLNNNSIKVFNLLNSIFINIGSNTLTRIKFITSIQNKFYMTNIF